MNRTSVSKVSMPSADDSNGRIPTVFSSPASLSRSKIWEGLAWTSVARRKKHAREKTWTRKGNGSSSRETLD